jgi:phage virion morphogenesis protein
MGGVTLTIDIDDVAAQAALDRIEGNADDLATLLDEIGSYLEFSTRERFETGTAPDGSKWHPPARGGQPLVLSGRLLGSINYQVGKDDVQVGTNVIYGRIHQKGGTIKHPGGTAFFIGKDGMAVFMSNSNGWASYAPRTRPHDIPMPARPYLGLSKADEEEIGIIATEWLLKGVGQKGEAP